MCYLMCRSKRKVIPGNRIGSQDGNVSVTVALCMVLLVSIMAFTLDTGYMLAEKSRYQQATEAAARAGALSLHSDDPVVEARRIAIANGCPDSEALIVQLGFYDEWNDYDDFFPFIDFQADPDLETPSVNEAVPKNSDGEDHYNNAVMVMVVEDTDGLTGGMSGTQMRIGAAAVAYLRRIDMLALGEDGIRIAGRWAADYPVYQDNILHANTAIHFNGTESFDGDTHVTAVETIDGGSGSTGVDLVEVPPIEWDALETEAAQQGTIYYPAQWPEGSPSIENDWGQDGGGNFFLRSGTTYLFWPAAGDHEGAVYFFALEDGQNAAGTIRINNDFLNLSNEPAYGLTLASPLAISIGTYYNNSGGGTIGAPEEGVVRIYSGGDIDFRDRYSSFGPPNYIFDGALLRSEQQVTMSTYMMNIGPHVPAHHRVRIIADAIEIENSVTYGSGATMVLDGLFSVPSPPDIVRLGRLVAAE